MFCANVCANMCANVCTGGWMISIAVLGTGGTIASRRDSAGWLTVSSGIDALLQDVVIPDGAKVDAEDVMSRPSFAISSTDLVSVAQAVRDRLQGSYDAVVVAHGTDTLEETAFLLAQVLPRDARVVLTGAQRGQDEPDWDGLRNLRDALAVAACAVPLGPAVVMGGVVTAAVEARKVHTSAVEAFSGGAAGAIALVDDGIVYPLGQSLRGAKYAGRALPVELPRVDLVKLVVGVDGVHVRASIEAGARGIVLEAFGSGNVTADMLAAIHEAIAQGVVVTVCSRTGGGHVRAIYGEGGGAEVAQAGAVFAGDLTGPRARIALALALAFDGEQDAVTAVRDMVRSGSW
ncbi:MAG TPA: asparaginase [Jatrophihabitans sp.]|nr:asparaginase [Jatrophihabitans sp.]